MVRAHVTVFPLKTSLDGAQTRPCPLLPPFGVSGLQSTADQTTVSSSRVPSEQSTCGFHSEHGAGVGGGRSEATGEAQGHVTVNANSTHGFLKGKVKLPRDHLLSIIIFRFSPICTSLRLPTNHLTAPPAEPRGWQCFRLSLTSVSSSQGPCCHPPPVTPLLCPYAPRSLSQSRLPTSAPAQPRRPNAVCQAPRSGGLPSCRSRPAWVPRCSSGPEGSPKRGPLSPGHGPSVLPAADLLLPLLLQQAISSLTRGCALLTPALAHAWLSAAHAVVKRGGTEGLRGARGVRATCLRQRATELTLQPPSSAFTSTFKNKQLVMSPARS